VITPHAVLADDSGAGQAGGCDRRCLRRTHVEDGFSVHAPAILDAITPADRAASSSIRRATRPAPPHLRRRAARHPPKVAAQKKIWLVVDLCYEKLIYDPVAAQPAEGAGRDVPRAGGRLRIGGRRPYAMTGWRCGWQNRSAGGDRRIERDPRAIRRRTSPRLRRRRRSRR